MICRNLLKRGTSDIMHSSTYTGEFTMAENPVLNVTHKPIKGFENLYWIAPNGEVRNARKPLKFFINNKGYCCITLTKSKKKFHCLIHRLVANTFIPNPNCKTEVNHRDGNKLNNNVCNLEWVTSAENKQHARKTGLSIYNRPSLGIKLSQSSQYFNVGYDAQRNKWRAGIRINGKTVGQKRFNSEEEAALHVNRLLDEYDIQDRPRNVVRN